MPTLSDFRTEVLDALQLISGDVSNARLDRAINRSLRRAQYDLEWLLMETTATLTLTAGQDGTGTTTYALPTRWHSDIVLYIIDGGSRYFLTRMNRQREVLAYPNVTGAGTGAPREYGITGSNRFFGPAPDKAYTVSQVFRQYLADLAATTDSNTLGDEFPRMVVCGAAGITAEDLGWFQEAQAWNGLWELERRRAIRRARREQVRNMPAGSRAPHVLR